MKVNKPLIILTIIFLVGITCIVFTAKSPYAAVLPYQIRILAQNCGSYSVYMGKEVNNKYNRAFFSWLRERTNQCLVKAKENCQQANATVFHSDWLKGQGKITYTVKPKNEEPKNCPIEIKSQTKAAYLPDNYKPQSYTCSNIIIEEGRIASPDCSYQDSTYDYCVDPLYILKHIGRCAINYGIQLKDLQICNILINQADISNCAKHVAQSLDTIDACLEVKNQGDAFKTCVVNYASRHQNDSVCSLFADSQQWLLEEFCFRSSAVYNNRLDEILQQISFSNLEEFTKECRSFPNYYTQTNCLDRIYQGLVYNSGNLVPQGKEVVHRWCLDQPVNDSWEMCLYSNEIGYSNPSSEMSLGKSDESNLVLGNKLRSIILDFVDSQDYWKEKLCRAIRWKTMGDKWSIADDFKEFAVINCGYTFLNSGDKGGY